MRSVAGSLAGRCAGSPATLDGSASPRPEPPLERESRWAVASPAERSITTDIRVPMELTPNAVMILPSAASAKRTSVPLPGLGLGGANARAAVPAGGQGLAEQVILRPASLQRLPERLDEVSVLV